MSMVLMILGALIFLGMVLHDRAQGYLLGAHFLEAAVEATGGPSDTEGHFLSEELEKRGVLTTAEYVKEADEAALERKCRELFGERVLISRLQDFQIQIGSRENSLYYRGNGVVTGTFSNGLLKQFLSMEHSFSYKRPIRSENFVRFCRGVVWREK